MKLDIRQVAMICHDVNRSYCASIGDDTQTSWDDAPDWQRESAINGVQFHIDNPDAGASSSHDSWMKEKVDSGWVHGDVKDAKAKTHPCIVDFDALPVEQKMKDFLFRGVVHSFVEGLK